MTAPVVSWVEVTRLLDAGEEDGAIAMARALVRDRPRFQRELKEARPVMSRLDPILVRKGIRRVSP